MSYGDLISVGSSFDLDTSNLEQRLDDIDTKLGEVEGMTEETIANLIDTAINDRDLVSRNDVDVEDLERRVNDLEDAEPQIGPLAVLEERVEKLERARAQESTVIDLLRQLARALVG